MSKRMRLFVVLAGVLIQIVVMLLYSFAVVEIPEYTYMVIWCVCAEVMRRSMNAEETL